MIIGRNTWAATASLAAAVLASSPARALECTRAAFAAGLPSNTSIEAATSVPANAPLPAYCRLEGSIDRQITFELRLPDPWNGKFLFQGYGGLDGAPPGLTQTLVLGSPGTPLPLQRGYAVVTTDTGHRGAILPGTTAPVYDGNWALNNPERQINFAYRSTHVVGDAAKAIINVYYGQPPRYSYYHGCSGGGRQAAMVAQRYPGDFNGVVSAAPWLNVTRQTAGFTWISQTLTRSPLPAAKLPIIARAVLAACDAQDGLVDGQVTEPHRCKADLKPRLCQAGDAADCLTEAQSQTLQRIRGGPATSNGEALFPGLEAGGEDLQWPDAIVNPETGGPGTLLSFLPEQILKYFVFGPRYDTQTFDFDRDIAALDAVDFLNVGPDLSGFRAAGGKLLMWHGLNDPRLSPRYSMRFRDDVVRTLGGDARATDDFFRLFLAPGVGHCGGGSGPNSIDALAALESWVENRTAPDRLIATRRTAQGATERARPLCPYPQFAAYDGHGNADDPGSFTCRAHEAGQ